MPRRIVALLVFLAALFVTIPALAQYMYLDSNGDGIHTDADVVPASGEADIDVWLVTNAGRDGMPAVCSTSNDPFKMNSYVVNLRAVGGTVAWGPFTNDVSGFTNLPAAKDSLEFQGGAYLMGSIDPGRYRLCTLRVAVTGGAPRIDIVPDSKYLVGPTSFGSPCGGLDFDNTPKLGQDWFDADGLDYPAAGQPPGFEPVDDVTIDENTMASRHIAAVDPDGEDLTFTMQGLPGFASASTPIHVPGRVDVDITFAPTYASAAWYLPTSYLISLTVEDAAHRRQGSFRVTVRNVNRPPVIQPIADVTIEVGTTVAVPIVATDPDPDGAPTLSLVDAPPFAGFAANQVELRPGIEDVGTYTVRVQAIDRYGASVTSTFQVTVANSGAHRPPTFDPIADLEMDEGTMQRISIHATAYEQDPVSLRMLEGPPYGQFSSQAYPGQAFGELTLSPGARDSGTVTVRLEASTTLYRSTVAFVVHVRNRPFPPEFIAGPGCVEPGGRGWSSFWVYAADLDSARVTCGDLPSWARAGYSQVGSFQYGFPTPGTLLIEMTPGPEEPPASVPVTLYLNRGTPEEMSWPSTLTISPYDACMGEGGGFLDGDPGPIPEAGGPYSGVAGAPVAFHASSSPPVAENAFRWTFGDGHAALGSSVTHAFAEGGTYRVVVRTSNRVASRDSADVVIADAYPARAVLDQAHMPLQLSRPGDFCVTLEQESDGFNLADLDPGSLWLRVARGGGPDSIRATVKNGLIAETNGSSARVHVCFEHAALDLLFAGVRGRLTVEGRVQGRLQSGARVRAPITLTVVGRAGDPGKVAIRPNPLNPTGTISFEIAHTGRVLARIYDVSGRLVRTLSDGVWPAGVIELPFDGMNGYGGALGSGVYYYRIESPDRSWTGRITVLK